VNLFIVQPGQRTCWHRHERQTDQFRVIKGKIRFGLIKNGMHSYYTYANQPGWKMTVEPGVWHGYENVGTEPAYLLMYLDQKYDPSDEERMTEEFCPWSPAL
jgi:dTDP-4-dehydrorhamnose 3,5-epimerase